MRAEIVRSAAAVVAGLLLFPAASLAQPVRDRLLADVRITEDPACAVIHVGFNFPVRYIRHFPYKTGDDLRIRIEPIAIGADDAAALSRRESASTPDNDFAGLIEVVFEGDFVTGPYLTLLFTSPVTFEVAQGTDFRSLTVSVVGPEPSDTCSPTP